MPVTISPLRLENLAQYFTRKREPNQSTDFAFSRFLVPYLSDYKGWSLFMDCDMLVRADISELWKLRDESKAVMVAKHDYVPKSTKKFLGAVQEPYPKKNWSSVMMFNNRLCSKLTPNLVNTAHGSELHQFKWLESEELIGSIPLEWNWLVDEYPYNPGAKNVHYTLGGPWFEEYKNVDYADEWFKALSELNSQEKRD